MARVFDADLLDAGKRASDAINMHILFNKWDDIKNKWMAISLADGSTDGVIYDNKKDAVKKQIHESQCAYVCFRNLMAGSRPQEMVIFLQFNRDAYAAGFRMPDPDDAFGGKQVLPTAAQGDYYRKGMVGNPLWLPKEIRGF